MSITRTYGTEVASLQSDISQLFDFDAREKTNTLASVKILYIGYSERNVNKEGVEEKTKREFVWFVPVLWTDIASFRVKSSVYTT